MRFCAVFLQTLFGLCCVPVFCATPAARDDFIEQHCVECHDAETKKGGLDLQALKFNLADETSLKKWLQVFERVRDGEMPPAKKARPPKEDLEKFLSHLKRPLVEADAADIAAKGRVHSRRLTRTEYEHTVHDLLGIDIPLKDLLPEDRGSHGFETVSDGQQLSHHQLARYLDVADLALDDAFDRALKGDAKSARFLTPEDLARSGRGNYRGPDLRDGESISWPIGLQFFGRMRATTVDAAGWYRITLKDVRAINPGRDGAVWGTLRSGECESNAPLLYLVGLVEATAEPRDLVYEAWIQEGHRLELRPNDGEHRKAPTGAKGGNVSFVGRDLGSEGYSGIAHRGITIERIYPNADSAAVKRNLFGDINPLTATAAKLDGLVTQFARRAFRRPVSEEQTAPYREIGHQSLADGDSVAEALRASYRAILCSPRFLTFIETPGALDDYAIASRLSYALWVSMPDATLTAVADAGKLKQPSILAQQVDRMLADVKSERFIASFTDQWLKLKEIDFTTPDPRQFRTFDSVLQQSLLTETRAYFAELIRNDLGVAKLVDSDFAFLNGRLARHYFPPDEPARSSSDKQSKRRQEDNGRDATTQTSEAPALSPYALVASALKPGQGLQKILLPSGSPRGGLLTQGAVLKVTADGTKTSPVVRGVFINERILGEHIPPPPPGIPAIEPDIRGATTIREQLEKHRSNTSCVVCHKDIDPPGFALENFDPVGGWRNKYDGSGARIDASGVTPEGHEFAGFQAWKGIYANRRTQLARSFASQFLTYATGAPPRFSNEAAMNRIVASAEKGGYGMRSLMREAVLSEVFLKK